MNYEWTNLGRPALPLQLNEKTAPEVLIEYDGPQLVLYHGSEGNFIGLWVDADASADRWLLARVSKLELEALALGDLPMRDIFSRKPSLELVDFVGLTSPKVMQAIALADVPREMLPEPGAPLPSFARAKLLKILKVKSSAPYRR